MGEAKRRKELGREKSTQYEQVWSNVISPRLVGVNGQLQFGEFDCLKSTVTALRSNLIAKMNVGVVLIWDTNEKHWENMYTWHCWGVTKKGQPYDSSLHFWEDLFFRHTPPIIPEKNPLEMSCQLIKKFSPNDTNNRNKFPADILYINGGLLTTETPSMIGVSSIPDFVAYLRSYCAKYNGLNLEQYELANKLYKSAYPNQLTA